MSILEAIIYTIKNDATVQGLVGARVHADVLPEDSPKPALLAYVSTETAEDCLTGFIGFDTATIRVESTGLTRKSANETLQAARMSLNGLQGIVQGVPIQGVSQSTGIFHLSDKPNDATDRWQFRSVQSFDISYHSFEGQ